jgi:tetratricopeptide (TPR) repeat protein
LSGHISDDIADYLADRLPSARLEEIRRHLDACTACAAEVAWAREFQEAALELGRRHIAPMRIVQLAAGEGEPLAAPESRHLDRCASCTGELEWARRQPSVEAIPDPTPNGASPQPAQRPEASRAWAWRPRWVGLAAALAAAAVVAVLLRPGAPRVETPTLAALARLEPLPVHMTRSPADAGSFEESRLLGLEAYAGGAYEEAIPHFQRAALLRPEDDEIRLYLGSAALLARRLELAAEHLEPLAVRTTDPTRLAEALWQLANLQLLQQRADAALSTLQRLESLDGRHAAEARQQIEALRRAAPWAR